MIANNCTTGKGINFIDVKDGTVLPKLLDKELGFAPRISVFAKE